MAEEYISFVREAMYKYAKSKGLTRMQTDEAITIDSTMSLKEKVTKDMAMDEYYEELITGFTHSQPQRAIIKGDKFFFTDKNGNPTEYETFTINKDTLTFTGKYDINDRLLEDDINIYPKIFVKQPE